ncbi:MAG: carbohydrate binding domain-containing protein [Candidatus Omnitrophota bacterium]
MKGKKILIWVTVIFMLSGVCFTSSAQETPETNLVINGSFEKGMSNWSTNPSAPQKLYSVDDSISTDSECSLKLDGTTTDTPFFMAAGGYESVLSGKLKPLTGYIVKADIRRTTAKGCIAVALLEKPKEKTCDEWTYHWCGKNPEKGLNTWEHFELKFKTNPKVDDVSIQLYNIGSGGIAWFDNIQLTEVSGN